MKDPIAIPLTSLFGASIFTAAILFGPAVGSLAAAESGSFVRVGNLNNSADEEQEGIQYGAVEYAYEIGKFEVTVAEYANFLNARAASDPNALYSESMEITREGEDGNYAYQVQEGKANRPIRWIEPVDAMRYCNWLHNGSLKTNDTESGAYTFSDPSTPGPRNPGAKYFLPNENEWYKAAYYDPTEGGSGRYWLFAVRSDDVVSALPPGGANSANFDAVNRDAGETTDVGAYTSAISYYGTFDQTGNVWEWLEPDAAAPDMSRRRSGSWENAIGRLSKTQTGVSQVLAGGSQHQGFRVARAIVSAPPTVQPIALEYVVVGNPDNKPDQPQGDPPRQFGTVGYPYRIGKFKVTVSQYAAFLNARATTDPFGLYNENMEITRAGEEGGYTYAVQEGKANRPIRWIDPIDALRFCNWLHNGGVNTSDTETGAYSFSDAITLGERNAGAKVFLPNEDEWYKAAYYDPTKNSSGGYWLYAVRADDVTADLPPGGPASANFDAVYRDNGETTDVGAYRSAHSFYGTFDQTGNTWEWLEPDPATPDRSRRRSGSWENAIGRLSNTQTGDSALDTGASQHQGFRVAAILPLEAPLILLTAHKTANGIELAWNGGGRLESAASVLGPWLVVDNAASPITVKTEGGHRFYRVVR